MDIKDAKEIALAVAATIGVAALGTVRWLLGDGRKKDRADAARARSQADQSALDTTALDIDVSEKALKLLNEVVEQLDASERRSRINSDRLLVLERDLYEARGAMREQGSLLRQLREGMAEMDRCRVELARVSAQAADLQKQLDILTANIRLPPPGLA